MKKKCKHTCILCKYYDICDYVNYKKTKSFHNKFLKNGGFENEKNYQQGSKFWKS